MVTFRTAQNRERKFGCGAPAQPPAQTPQLRKTNSAIDRPNKTCMPKSANRTFSLPTWPSSLNKDRYKKYTTIIRTRNKREEKEARQSVTTRSSPGLLPPLIGCATVHG